MSDDNLYILAAKEAAHQEGTERNEALWEQARTQAGGNKIETTNNYVNLRVAQLKDGNLTDLADQQDGSPVSSVKQHPEFISVAKYCAKNNVNARHVVQSIRDGHYIGREVDGEWYIYIGKSRFLTHEERNRDFFFDRANELAESGSTDEDPDNLVNLERTQK